jgi:hypothetical protein
MSEIIFEEEERWEKAGRPNYIENIQTIFEATSYLYLKKDHTYYYDENKGQIDIGHEMMKHFIHDFKHNTHTYNYIFPDFYELKLEHLRYQIFPFSGKFKDTARLVSLMNYNTEPIKWIIQYAHATHTELVLMCLNINIYNKKHSFDYRIETSLKKIIEKNPKRMNEVKSIFINHIKNLSQNQFDLSKEMQILDVYKNVFGVGDIHEFIQELNFTKKDNLFTHKIEPKLELFQININSLQITLLDDSIFNFINEAIDEYKSNFPKCYLVYSDMNYYHIGVEENHLNNIEKIQLLIQKLIDTQKNIHLIYEQIPVMIEQINLDYMLKQQYQNISIKI